MSKRRLFVRVEDLLGKRVFSSDGGVVGRIEEIRADRHGRDHEVTEILLGTGALLERLALRRRTTRRPLVARWDQLDLRRPERIVLLCPAEDLRRDR